MGLLRRLAWGAVFAVAGLVVAFGWMPGSASWEEGPRIGIATVLIMTGATAFAMAAAPAFLRRTTKPEDYKGTCPVGATCACGHFNFKPRASCRQCGAATKYA